MAGEVQFEEDNSYSRPSMGGNEETKGIIGLVMRTGIVKDEKQATYLLLGIMIVNIAIISFLLFGGGNSGGSSVPTPASPPASQFPIIR